MPVADSVVVVVFDGLRPDMIAGRMPNLEAFAAESMWYREARSVFPSYTRAATTATATGCWPQQNGIIGNAFHQPDILRGEPIDTSNFAHLELLAQQDPNGLIHVPSLGQRLAADGKRMAAVHCGSAGSAYLINHKVRQNGHWTLSALGAEGTQTPEIMERAAVLGPLPSMDIPKFEVVDYAKRAFQALTEGQPEDQPDVTFIWFPEPDTSYHYREIGSEPTRAVMEGVDKAFAEIVDTIRSRPGGERTAIIAMSDHGQISTTGLFEMDAVMTADGLQASYRPDEDTKIALTQGAAGECRMLTDDTALPGIVAQWLMQRDEIGMVFARDDLFEGIEGSLPLSLVNLNHRRAPELMYVMRSSDAPDPYGLPGTGMMTGGVPVGGGMHGGLNLHELNTVLMINAPDGRKGDVHHACGLIDVAPTVLGLLGSPDDGTGGRYLDDKPEEVQHEITTHRAQWREFQQTVEMAQRGGVRFILQGGRCVS